MPFPALRARAALLLLLCLLTALAAPARAELDNTAVASFTLINADTNSPITAYDPLPDGVTINLATLPTRNLNLRANTNPATVGSVRFAYAGDADFRMENDPPYALQGDSSGNYAAWTPAAGSQTVTATPFDGANGSGTAGTPLTIQFTVIDTPNQAPAVNAGPDRTITLPTSSVVLNGSAADPDGSIDSIQWSKVAGPAATLDGTATTTLTAANLVAGVYRFRLTAVDNQGAQVADEAVVFVIDPNGGGSGTVGGELVKWHPVTVSFDGPQAAENDDDPNPFLDYRLQVTFLSPGGRTLVVPGFFDGDGSGGGSGTVWRVRFAPDEAGTWQYFASFRSGVDVAVSLDPAAGTPVSFDGAAGSFEIAPRDPDAPGFLKWGRLDYVDGHYRRFVDGPFWIKGGTDSPENFLAYAGFDNTFDQPGGVDSSGLTDGVHRYPSHAADWNSGDPNFVSADTGYDGKAIIGALNYLSSRHVNSIYFLPLNLGGDGREVYPFIDPSGSPWANTHYDVSKLWQWNIVFDHAQRQGIGLHFVLAETEPLNESWLDNGDLGVERKLYYRELIARFGYALVVKWNLSEENDYSAAELRAFADYIRALDWADHPISVHTKPNNFTHYNQISGDARFQAASIQYDPNQAGSHVETWRANSAAAGQPWVLDMDENNPAGSGLTDSNADDLRKRVLYDVYFSGGHIEWYAGYHGLPLGGDIRLEDFRTREAMWDYMWYARRLLQEEFPFWSMEPRDELLTGESTAYGGGEVFALPGAYYAIYLPDASPSGSINLSGAAGASFTGRWFNPRTGQFAGSAASIGGGGSHALGAPPSSPDEDWVYVIQLAPSDFHYLPLAVAN